MRCGHPVVDEIPDDNPFKQTICNLVTGEEMSYEEIWEKLEEAYNPIQAAFEDNMNETSTGTGIEQFNPDYVHELEVESTGGTGVGRFEFIRDGGEFELVEEKTELESAFAAFEEGTRVIVNHDEYGEIDTGEVLDKIELSETNVIRVDSDTTVGPDDVDIDPDEVRDV